MYKQEDASILASDNKEIPISYAINFIQDGDRFVGAVLVFHDITNYKLAQQMLLERSVLAEQLASENAAKLNQSRNELKNISIEMAYKDSHDSLTGLYNRAEFEKRLESLAVSTLKTNDEHVLLYIDIDQFNIINDNCGHLAGDKMLKIITGIFNKKLRNEDYAARLGGDEFVLLLKNCTSAQGLKIATSIKNSVQDFRFEWCGNIYNFTVSIGLVSINHDTVDYNQVLKNADIACYVAKDAGRNCIRVFHPDDKDLAKRHNELKRVGDINRAFEENRFRLYYQSIAPIEKIMDQGSHFEILLRMVVEDGKLIAPGEFLSAAERFNLIGRIDRWVVSEVLKTLAAHQAKLSQIEMCSINLSGQSITDNDFCSYVATLFNQYNIPASKICFEITETAAIANFKQAVNFINQLKKLGCKFALDDFGSGLSSLAYLKNLPVDYLKIDGIFVKDITKTHVDYAMVKSINELGRVMGKQMIAEFVEDKATLSKLNEIGVDYAQGYGIAKPCSINELFNDDK